MYVSLYLFRWVDHGQPAFFSAVGIARSVCPSKFGGNPRASNARQARPRRFASDVIHEPPILAIFWKVSAAQEKHGADDDLPSSSIPKR